MVAFLITVIVATLVAMNLPEMETWRALVIWLCVLVAMTAITTYIEWVLKGRPQLHEDIDERKT